MRIRIALLVLGFALSGCSAAHRDAKVNLGGYPPAFREGYADGCDSARRLVGLTRNETRFKSDAMYATGWRDGYDICGKGRK